LNHTVGIGGWSRRIAVGPTSQLFVNRLCRICLCFGSQPFPQPKSIHPIFARVQIGFFYCFVNCDVDAQFWNILQSTNWRVRLRLFTLASLRPSHGKQTANLNGFLIRGDYYGFEHFLHPQHRLSFSETACRKGLLGF